MPTRRPGGGAQDGVVVDRQHTLQEHDMQLVLTDPSPTSGKCIARVTEGQQGVGSVACNRTGYSESRFEKVDEFQDRQGQQQARLDQDDARHHRRGNQSYRCTW